MRNLSKLVSPGLIARNLGVKYITVKINVVTIYIGVQYNVMSLQLCSGALMRCNEKLNNGK